MFVIFTSRTYEPVQHVKSVVIGKSLFTQLFYKCDVIIYFYRMDEDGNSMCDHHLGKNSLIHLL